MTTPYINVVAVKRGNVEASWAQDIVAGYKSQTFKTAILSDRFYDGFALPDYLKRTGSCECALPTPVPCSCWLPQLSWRQAL
jgi:hypothetical protein